MQQKAMSNESSTDDDAATITGTLITNRAKVLCESKNMQHENRYASCDDTNFEGGSEDEEHPLFMLGLPSNFASNKGLAAIASLIGEENEIKEECLISQKHSTGRLGRGKIQIKASRDARKEVSNPYGSKNNTLKSEKRATISETQLFLKLWTI